MEKIGKRLKHLRTDNNMTQAALAQKLNLTKSVISAYENDLRLPSYDVLIQIAKIFHVSTDYLFGLETSAGIDLSGLSDEEKNAVRNLIQAMKHKK